jgi:hypothetical protein
MLLTVVAWSGGMLCLGFVCGLLVASRNDRTKRQKMECDLELLTRERDLLFASLARSANEGGRLREALYEAKKVDAVCPACGEWSQALHIDVMNGGRDESGLRWEDCWSFHGCSRSGCPKCGELFDLSKVLQRWPSILGAPQTSE